MISSSTASILLSILFPVDILLLIVYFRFTYTKSGYIVSLFNIPIFTFGISLVIAPVFFFSDESWYALGIMNAESMSDYTSISLAINLIGFLFFLIFLLMLTIRDHRKSPQSNSAMYNKKSLIIQTGEAISPKVVDAVFVCACFGFTIICMIYNNGSFPLLNGGRSFYYQTSISPLYLAIYNVLIVLGLYYGVRCCLRKGGLVFLSVAVVLLFLSGSRSGAIVTVLAPTAVYYVYSRVLRSSTSLDETLARLRRASLSVVLFATLIVIIGISFSLYRSSQVIDFGNILHEAVYGNTFSDVRDGALILKGLESSFDNTLILGKTYLAGFISFIPSSISDFREIWSWGRFTSSTLLHFGFQHFGLRGGWFMESYVNFGIAGVIILGSILSTVLFKLETFFRKVFLYGYGTISGKEIFYSMFVYMTFCSLYCTSGFYTLYVCIVLIFILEFFSMPFINQESRISNRIPHA